jgi:hypothetical protein
VSKFVVVLEHCVAAAVPADVCVLILEIKVVASALTVLLIVAELAELPWQNSNTILLTPSQVNGVKLQCINTCSWH